jgi:perosamine synthetase
MDQKIDWYSFSFWGDEKKYVNDALDSTWLSGGGYLEKFEKTLASKLELPNAFVVANGTAALQLAFLVIGIQPGDEVIVPAFGFMAAANVLKLMHATPVFADIDKDHWGMTTETISAKITDKTKAIVVIHNYGVVADMEAIKNLSMSKGLYLIEDCAESIFSKFNGKYCGLFGDLSTFSFHATKTIATGEGGMVSCKNEVLADRLKLIRSHGLKREKKHYWHEYYGNNFRLSNILAAIGLGQLEKAEEIIANKFRVFNKFKEGLGAESRIKFQAIPSECEPVIWAIAISVHHLSFDRDNIMEKLIQNGIECRPGFYTSDQLDLYNNGNVENNFPIANAIAASVIVLPSYPKLLDVEIDRICEILKSILSQND